MARGGGDTAFANIGRLKLDEDAAPRRPKLIQVPATGDQDLHRPVLSSLRTLGTERSCLVQLIEDAGVAGEVVADQRLFRVKLNSLP